MEPKVCRMASASGGIPKRVTRDGEDALARYDGNRNGRSTCGAARRHVGAPIHHSPRCLDAPVPPPVDAPAQAPDVEGIIQKE